MELLTMEQGEEAQAAAVLSIAMLDNPLHRAVLQGKGENERQRIEEMFLEMLTKRAHQVIVARTEREIIGVLRYQGCHDENASPSREPIKDALNETSLIDTDSRIAYWLDVWDEHDPPQRHQHLGPVGVLPEYQGRGVGSSMMEMFCEEVDAISEPAYLETDKLVNVGFYEKFGFRLTGETILFDVENYFMWREAR